MTKTELIDAIGNEADVSKAAASRALNATFAAIAKSLAEGEPVSLVGFGTFLMRERSARTGAIRRPGSPSKSPPPRCPPSSRPRR